jgi:hypothetical protein
LIAPLSNHSSRRRLEFFLDLAEPNRTGINFAGRHSGDRDWKKHSGISLLAQPCTLG